MARARWLNGKRVRIIITEDVLFQLKLLKNKNENYNDVINRLLRAYKEGQLSGF